MINGFLSFSSEYNFNAEPSFSLKDLAEHIKRVRLTKNNIPACIPQILNDENDIEPVSVFNP